MIHVLKRVKIALLVIVVIFAALTIGIHLTNEMLIQNQDTEIDIYNPTYSLLDNETAFVVLTLLFLAIFIFLDVYTNRSEKSILKTDSATGCENYSYFRFIYSQRLKRSEAYKKALVVFEIQDFEDYRNRHGNDKADYVLISIAEIFSILKTKPCDGFARYDKCNFIYLYGFRKEVEISAFIDRINGLVKDVELISGYCVIEGDTSLEIQQGRATIALNAVKNKKFSKSVNFVNIDDSDSEKYVTDNIKSVLETKELKMQLLPKYDVQNSRYVGAKALVRWIKKDGTMIPPGVFLPMFEKTGFIMKSDIYILKTACECIQKWIEADVDPMPISISVSKKYFINSSFIKKIITEIKNHNIPYELIIIDIAGTNVSISIKQLLDIGTEFEGREFLIEADHMGSGSMLKVIDSITSIQVNLSGSLSLSAMEDHRTFSTLKNMLDVFKERGISTLAEHIETKDQFDTIKNLGCDYAMGYYFSEAVSISKFEKIVYGKYIL